MMKNKALLIAGVAAVIAYLVLRKKPDPSGGGGGADPSGGGGGAIEMTRAQKIAQFDAWASAEPGADPYDVQTFMDKIESMSDAELGACYMWVFDYSDFDDRQARAPQWLKDTIKMISDKYQIFT